MKYRKRADRRLVSYSAFMRRHVARVERLATTELELFMKNQDESYLQWVLTNPVAAAQISGVLSYCHKHMDPGMYTQVFNGQQWQISFSTGHKCPGLRVATLVHPSLKIEIREQNPTKETIMAEYKRAGREVFQIYVNEQPVRFICDGEFWDIAYEDRLLRQSS